MRIAVVSLFPSMLRDALNYGVLGRAIERGLLDVECFDPRDHATDAARSRWFGSSAGGVAEPILSNTNGGIWL